MTGEQLQAIKDRITAIGDHSTWTVESNEKTELSSVESAGYVVGIEMAEEDAQFIAHARQDVPALIAEVERLRDALEDIASTGYTFLEMVGIAEKALGGESNEI